MSLKKTKSFLKALSLSLLLPIFPLHAQNQQDQIKESVTATISHPAAQTVARVIAATKQVGLSAMIDDIDWNGVFASLSNREKSQRGFSSEADVKDYYKNLFTDPSGFRIQRLRARAESASPEKRERRLKYIDEMENVYRQRAKTQATEFQQQQHRIVDVQQIDDSKAIVKVEYAFKLEDGVWNRGVEASFDSYEIPMVKVGERWLFARVDSLKANTTERPQ